MKKLHTFFICYTTMKVFMYRHPHTHTYDDDEWYQLNRMIVQSQSPPRVAFIV